MIFHFPVEGKYGGIKVEMITTRMLDSMSTEMVLCQEKAQNKVSDVIEDIIE